MKKLKVLLTTIENGLNKDKGGPTRVIYNLLNFNTKRRQKIQIFCVFSKKICSENCANENEINKSDRKNSIVKFLKNIQVLYLIIACIRFTKMLYKFFKQNKIDLVNAHDVFSAAIYLFLFKPSIKKPIVLTIHSKGSWVKRELQCWIEIKRILLLVEKYAALNADMLVFPSKAAANYFMEDIPQVKKVKKKIRIVHNGIDINSLSIDVNVEDSINRILKKIGNKKIILSVTPLVKEKGVDILVKAFLMVNTEIRKKTCLLIVGEGPEYKNLKKIFANTDDILLIAKLKHEEILLLMKKSTLFVLPHRMSIFDYVLLEAMISKLPIITTSVGGNLEIFIKEGSVYFVPSEDIKKLKDAIEFLIENEEYRKNIAQVGYDLVVREFSAEKMIIDYENLYLCLYHSIESKI